MKVYNMFTVNMKTKIFQKTFLKMSTFIKLKGNEQEGTLT